MTGMVQGWCDLFHKKNPPLAFAHDEHFHGQDADIVEGLCDTGRDLPGLVGEGWWNFCRHARSFQNMVTVFVFGDFKTFDLAIASSRGDHCNFPLEIDEAFKDAWRIVRGSPGR